MPMLLIANSRSVVPLSVDQARFMSVAMSKTPLTRREFVPNEQPFPQAIGQGEEIYKANLPLLRPVTNRVCPAEFASRSFSEFATPDLENHAGLYGPVQGPEIKTQRTSATRL